MRACACVRASARVGAREGACVCVRVRACVRVRVCVCACNWRLYSTLRFLEVKHKVDKEN